MTLALLLLLDLPGEMFVGLSLLVLLKLPHVALFISLCLVQVSLPGEERKVRRAK